MPPIDIPIHFSVCFVVAGAGDWRYSNNSRLDSKCIRNNYNNQLPRFMLFICHFTQRTNRLQPHSTDGRCLCVDMTDQIHNHEKRRMFIFSLYFCTKQKWCVFLKKKKSHIGWHVCCCYAWITKAIPFVDTLMPKLIHRLQLSLCVYIIRRSFTRHFVISAQPILIISNTRILVDRPKLQLATINCCYVQFSISTTEFPFEFICLHWASHALKSLISTRFCPLPWHLLTRQSITHFCRRSHLSRCLSLVHSTQV